MKTILLHDQYCREHLDDRTAARALVDHSQEEYGWSRRDALRFVAALRRQARSTRDLETAAALMAEGSRYRAELLADALDDCGVGAEVPVTFALIAGSQSPDHRQWDWHGDGDHYPYVVVRVGARWIIRQHTENCMRREIARHNFARHESAE